MSFQDGFIIHWNSLSLFFHLYLHSRDLELIIFLPLITAVSGITIRILLPGSVISDSSGQMRIWSVNKQGEGEGLAEAALDTWTQQ